jgi:hypothetical protein
LILFVGKNKVIQRQYNGKNDFVGHTWTLPRVYLRYYLNMEPVSRGERSVLESIFSLRSETDLSPLNGGVYESIPYCCNAYEICTSSPVYVVVQNGFYVNASAIIQKFRVQHPDIELQHIASSKNLRYC